MKNSVLKYWKDICFSEDTVNEDFTYFSNFSFSDRDKKPRVVYRHYYLEYAIFKGAIRRKQMFLQCHDFVSIQARMGGYETQRS